MSKQYFSAGHLELHRLENSRAQVHFSADGRTTGNAVQLRQKKQAVRLLDMKSVVVLTFHIRFQLLKPSHTIVALSSARLRQFLCCATAHRGSSLRKSSLVLLGSSILDFWLHLRLRAACVPAPLRRLFNALLWRRQTSLKLFGRIRYFGIRILLTITAALLTDNPVTTSARVRVITSATRRSVRSCACQMQK